ncbi:hypothetical protein LZ30DRAFT_189651 [Colletotrichum cereale]|nr:hypothetical protein LZ30DRAFT_189651 [Colletotrichum cereale]
MGLLGLGQEAGLGLWMLLVALHANLRLPGSKIWLEEWAVHRSVAATTHFSICIPLRIKRRAAESRQVSAYGGLTLYAIKPWRGPDERHLG